MSISPGTERSITKIADSLARLEHSIELILRCIKPSNRTRCEDVPLSIALTDDEWVEVATAIWGKADRLRKDELPGDDMSKEQLDDWAEVLESAYKKITAVLRRNHISY